MPTAFHGVSAKLYGAGYDLTPFAKSIKAKGEVGVYDKTALADLWRIFLRGRASGELTAEAIHATAAAEFGVIAPALHGTEKTFMYCPEGNTAGSAMVGIKGSVVSRAIATELANVNMAVLNVQAKSAIDLGRLIMASQSIAGTTTTATVDTTTASTSTAGATLYYNVISYAGTAAQLTVKLQDSADDSAWLDVAGGALAAADIAAGASGILDIPGVIRRYVRIVATDAGAMDECTLAVGLGKRWSV